MSKANIHQRGSLEQAYPADAFAGDAARNGLVTNELVFGVRILSAPDAAGNFELERASRQVGERVSAAFLAPYRRNSADLDATEDYLGFLSEIVAAAREFGFRQEQSPGPDDPRLRGLRQ